MDALRVWSADHIAEVVAARADFDARSSDLSAVLSPAPARVG
jgi:hypothetical protein